MVSPAVRQDSLGASPVVQEDSPGALGDSLELEEQEVFKLLFPNRFTFLNCKDDTKDRAHLPPGEKNDEHLVQSPAS